MCLHLFKHYMGTGLNSDASALTEVLMPEHYTIGIKTQNELCVSTGNSALIRKLQTPNYYT